MEVRMSCSEKILAWIKFLSRNWKTLIRFEGAKLKGGGNVRWRMGRSCPLGGLIIQGWKCVGLCRQVASIAEEEEASVFCIESLLLLRGKCRVSEVQFDIGKRR